MKLTEKLSLQVKLIAMVLFVISVLGGGSYFNMVRSNGHFRDAVFGRFQNSAEDLGSALAAQFYERYGDVQAFAVNKSIQSMNSKSIQDDLDSYVTLYGIYDLIIVVDPQGHFVSSNSKDVAGKGINQKELAQINYSQAPWFKAAMAGKFTDDKAKGYSGTYFEDPHVDPLLKAAVNEDRVMTGFTTTIKDGNGQILGVISNRANSKWIDTELIPIYEDLADDGETKVRVTVSNKEGLIIADLNVMANGGKKQVVYDLEKTFLKVNVKDAEGDAGEHLVSGKSGVTLATNKTEGTTNLVGYHHIENPKWIGAVGWGTMVYDGADEALGPIRSAQVDFWVVLAISVAIAITAAIIFGAVLSRTLSHLSQTLTSNSNEVADASHKLASSSAELSEGAVQQAAALQETVAAVDEISAMVDKNAESANRSKEASAHSRDAALKGRQIVDNMIQAIAEISQSNDQVGDQMNSNNIQLTEITQLINDIGSKTKVINEIVFQTKLLSFNASVEAARAGEYGKGFAVVAEEVGNLAQMSGNAAKEITSLLEESVRKVEAIVNESRTKVDRLMSDAKEKVATGSETAATCNQALEEILTNVSSVDVLVSEIAVASQEQSTGIREIAKAVGQLEQVTQKNSTVATMSSEAADNLNVQSTNLKEIIKDLVKLVRGSGAVVTERSNTNIIPFVKKNKVQASRAREVHHEEAPPVKVEAQFIRKASGSEAAPSSDDPGFGE